MRFCSDKWQQVSSSSPWSCLFHKMRSCSEKGKDDNKKQTKRLMMLQKNNWKFCYEIFEFNVNLTFCTGKQRLCPCPLRKIHKFSHNPPKHALFIIVVTVYCWCYYYSYIVHCGTEIVQVGWSRLGHKVQQVNFLCASPSLMVTDLICWSVGINQLNGLSL